MSKTLLEIIIKNEKQALQLMPVIDPNVRRTSFIKEIDPEELIKYAAERGLAIPEVMHNVLWTTIEMDSCAIHLESKPIKVEQHWSYDGSKPEYPQLIEM